MVFQTYMTLHVLSTLPKPGLQGEFEKHQIPEPALQDL